MAPDWSHGDQRVIKSFWHGTIAAHTAAMN